MHAHFSCSRADHATHYGNQGISSGLLWLPWTEIVRRDDYGNGGNVVHTSPARGICRVRNKGGCGWAHGELWFGAGYKHCRAITKDKNYDPADYYQVLYAPSESNYEWRSWPQGTGNTKFPENVVVSDPTCKTMVGRYNDDNEVAAIYPDGHVYYQHGPGTGWYWDNNEYDLLVEKIVSKIEILDMKFDDPTKEEDNQNYAGDKSRSTGTYHNCNRHIPKTVTKRLSIRETDTSTYSHSINMAVKIGASVTVTSPGKAAIGGFDTTYSLEKSFSYEHGWSTGKSKAKDHSLSVTVTIPPRSGVHLEMFMHKTIKDVPYTATYRIHFEDGSSKVTKDRGIMKNVSFSREYSKTTEFKPRC